MDKNGLQREIRWYTDEIKANERKLEEEKSKLKKLEQDVRQCELIIPELERKLKANQIKLEEYQRDLKEAEAKETQRKF